MIFENQLEVVFGHEYRLELFFELRELFEAKITYWCSSNFRIHLEIQKKKKKFIAKCPKSQKIIFRLDSDFLL